LKEYEAAEVEFTRSLELLTLEGDRDWETIVKANNELAAVLFALGRDEEAKERLDRVATIEETISVE
jgi:hypothetical protein